jgi:hypothetical protein
VTKKLMPRNMYDHYNEQARKLSEHRKAWESEGLSMQVRIALFDLDAWPGQKIEMTTEELAKLLERMIPEPADE